MVTLITEQLQSQSLDEPAYRRAFSLGLPMPESHSTKICWPAYGLTPENGCWQLYTPAKPPLQDEPPPPVGPVPVLVPSTSTTDLSSPPALPAPPPPPPKRHCRSLSVPEDLSRCRSSWRPSASKIWTPVKRRCHSGGAVGGACPQRAPSSSHSSSSPTFYSLALVSCDSPLPWSFSRGGDCCCPHPCASSCASSPSPLCPPPHLLHRRFSLSPVHIHEAAAHFLPPAPPPATVATPSSSSSTPSSTRRALPLPLPRCHSQPCGLKRRHAPDALPLPRPGLDFGKMTQTRSGDPLGCVAQASGAGGGGPCLAPEPDSRDFPGTFSPAEGLGRTSICPLSESEEEEEEEEEERRRKSEREGPPQCLFERDCTELDLTLIEEN